VLRNFTRCRNSTAPPPQYISEVRVRCTAVLSLFSSSQDTPPARRLLSPDRETPYCCGSEVLPCIISSLSSLAKHWPDCIRFSLLWIPQQHFYYRTRSSALRPTPNLDDWVSVFMSPSDTEPYIIIRNLLDSIFNTLPVLIFIHSAVAPQPFVGPWPLLQFRNPYTQSVGLVYATGVMYTSLICFRFPPLRVSAG
jgi:hypothetical protein